MVRHLKNVLPVSNPKSGCAGYEFPECKPFVAPLDLDTEFVFTMVVDPKLALFRGLGGREGPVNDKNVHGKYEKVIMSHIGTRIYQ